jgi:hypothetical protein
LALEKADRFRNLIPQWCQHEPLLGCSLMIAGAALAASLSAYLVRRYSMLGVAFLKSSWQSMAHTSSTFYFAAG